MIVIVQSLILPYKDVITWLYTFELLSNQQTFLGNSGATLRSSAMNIMTIIIVFNGACTLTLCGHVISGGLVLWVKCVGHHSSMNI
jgi:hypothetical protein